jgi:hypothetical protein
MEQKKKKENIVKPKKPWIRKYTKDEIKKLLIIEFD